MAQIAVFTQPTERSSTRVYDQNVLLQMQYCGFKTLVEALDRLPSSKHEIFLAQVIAIITDEPNTNLSLTSMADLLFSRLDHAQELTTILRMQNAMVHVTRQLNGGSHDR